MLKKLLIGVSAFAVLLMVALSYITARFVDRDEILRVKTEALQLQKSRDSILFAVAVRDSMERELEAQRDSLTRDADTLRARVASLEQQRAAAQLSVRRLRRRPELEERLRTTFPEVAGSAWGVMELFDEREQVGVEYFLVPVGFAETFIIDHQNAASFLQQRDSLRILDSLNTRVISLQDSIVRLERDNRAAFQTGYNEAFTKYEDLNGKYVSLLERPPQVKFGFPRWPTILGSAAAGVLIGTQLKE